MIIGIHEGLIDQISGLVGSLGVLATGTAAIITAILSKRAERKRGLAECDQRIAELAAAYKEGMKIADARPRRRKGDLHD